MVRQPDTMQEPVTIQQLFDFTATHWVSADTQASIKSFDQELQRN